MRIYFLPAAYKMKQRISRLCEGVLKNPLKSRKVDFVCGRLVINFDFFIYFSLDNEEKRVVGLFENSRSLENSSVS